MILYHKKRLYLGALMFGLLLAAAFLASRGQSASQSRASASPITQPAAASMGVFRRAANAADRAASRTAAVEGPRLTKAPAGVPDDLLPGKIDASKARELINVGGHTVWGAPTNRGVVCEALPGFSEGCMPGFSPDTPISYTYGDPAPGEAGIVYGLAPDNVAAVQVVVNGQTVNAAMGRNAFLYQGTASSEAFDALIVQFAGGTSKRIALQHAQR